jgi:hypothetical protein
MDPREAGWECMELYSRGTGQGSVTGSCEHEVVMQLNQQTPCIHAGEQRVSRMNQ